MSGERFDVSNGGLVLLNPGPGLLAAWSGSVAVRVSYLAFPRFGHVWDGAVLLPPFGELGPEAEVVGLDLGCWIGRASLMRAVAVAVGLENPLAADGLCWAQDAFEQLHNRWKLQTWNVNFSAWFDPEHRGYAERAAEESGHPYRVVPGLAALDPTDESRLPDGTSRRGARALALVAIALLEASDAG